MPAFSSLDSLNGAAGTDTLNWVQTGAAITAAPAGSTVTGIEVVNLTVDAFAITLDTTTSAAGFTGLTTLSTTNTGAAQTITTGATIDVTVTDSLQAATAVAVNGGKAVTVASTGLTNGGAITIGATTAAKGAVTVTNASTIAGGTAGTDSAVTGGTTVNITNTITTAASNTTATLNKWTVTGTADTTAVTVTQAASKTTAAVAAAVDNTSAATVLTLGVVDGAVVIADANAGSATVAATIAAVTLQNYGISTISSNKLATLTLSNTGDNITGTLGLTDGLTTVTVTALALNLGGGSLGVITDASNKFTTVNAVMSADTTVAQFVDTAARTLAISGTGVLTLTTSNTALTAINVTGAAGYAGTIVGSGLTSFTAANTTGNNTVTLTATSQAYTGGTGNDNVTIGVDATSAITGSTGTDTLTLAAGTAGAAFTLANTGTKVTGFEKLSTSTTTGTVDMSLIGGSAFNSIQVTGNATTTFSKVTAGAALELTAASTAIVYQTSDTSGTTDSVAVTLTGLATVVKASQAAFSTGFTTTALTLKDANSVGIGSVSINSVATVSGGLHTIGTLTDANLATLAVSGSGGLNITNTITTAATTLTVSNNNTSSAANVWAGFTAATLGTLNYSGTHATTLTALSSVASTNVTIANTNTGTSGVLTIGAFTDANLTNLTLTGSVALTGVFAAATAATFSGSTNNSIVNITAIGGGIKTVTLGNGANVIVTGAAVDAITLGTGANTVTAGAGVDAITVAAHTGSNTFIVNNVVATSSDSARVATAGNDNDTGQDVITGFTATTDLIKVATTGMVGTYVHATNSFIGTATGGVDNGTVGSFTALTGLVDLAGDGTIGTGDIAVTFASPTVTLTSANFSAALQYDITGLAGGNTTVFTGGGQADTFRVSAQTGTSLETYTSGAGADTFVIASLAAAVNGSVTGNTTSAFMDKIADFTVGTDTIRLGTGAAAFGTGITFTAATTVTIDGTYANGATDRADFAALATAAAGGITEVASSSGALHAFIVTTGTIATASGFSNKTFLVINNATATLESAVDGTVANSDTWIDITGVSTTFTTASITFG